MEVPEVVTRYAHAFASSEVERCIATFAPNGTYSDPNTPKPLARDAIEQYFKTLRARFPDAHYGLLTLDAVSEDVCVCRWLMHTGSFEGAPRPGRATLPICEFITVRGGKIHRVEGYFDRLTLLQQLGISLSSYEPPSRHAHLAPPATALITLGRDPLDLQDPASLRQRIFRDEDSERSDSLAG